MGTHRDWRIALLFIAGLIVSATMLARSQVAGDQLNLLGLGWLLVEHGTWTPHGNPTTGAGVTPGGVTAIVVGLPLAVWEHHRAPAALIWFAHLVGYLLLDAWLKNVLSRQERFLFALLYWFNPWRLYHSAFLWNPNYLFFFGSIHLTTAFAMRSRSRYWPTFWHVLSLGLALQLEVIALPLALSTLLLWWRRYIRIDWAAAATATSLIALSLVPFALAVLEDPSLMAREKGFLGFGMVMVYPVYRGVMYWVRYSTLALSEELFCLDYAYLVGRAWMDRIAPWLDITKMSFYALSLPVSAWAFFGLWRGAGKWWRATYSAESDRDWLIAAVRWGFIAGVVVFCIAPSNIMRWHVLGLFHLAVLTPVLFFGPRLEASPGRWIDAASGRWIDAASGRWLDAASARWLHRGLRLYIAATAAVVLLVALGAPMVRCGGDRCGRKAVTMPPLMADHPMLDRLGIHDTCPVEVGKPDGFWIHSLPRPTPSPSSPGAGER